MKPKPKHLGTAYGEQFKDKSIVDAYHLRPPYPEELFPFLVGLAPGAASVVLDVGCGLGDLARLLTHYVDRVDAVDFSEEMIAQGRQLPQGEAANLNWILGPVETVPLSGPYDLITAGQSLHWMEWQVVLPRFARLLVAGAYLVIVGRVFEEEPWQEELQKLIAQFSTNQEFEPYNLVQELESRHLFLKQGEKVIEPQIISQTVTELIEAIHSSNGFSRDRMTPENAAAFDTTVRDLITSYNETDEVQTAVATRVIWGFPLPLAE